jgi:hypothetical protein
MCQLYKALRRRIKLVLPNISLALAVYDALKRHAMLLHSDLIVGKAINKFIDEQVIMVITPGYVKTNEPDVIYVFD